jgi:hypothetical protein
MADTSFGREPKMHTTEPSADEVKMKKGGRMMLHKAEGGEVKKLEKELKQHEGMKAGKAHHGLKKGGRAAGGMTPAAMQAIIPEAIARRALPIMGRRDAPVVPSAGAMMKRGGKAMHKAEGGAADIDSAQAHRLGREGMPHGNAKGMTGGVEGPGYKRGGKIMHKADGGVIKGVRGSEPKATKVVVDRMVQNRKDGGSIAPFVNNPHEAKQGKGVKTTTGGVEGAGYKHGGKVLHKAEGGSISKWESNMSGFSSHKGGKETGDVANYKKGGSAGYGHNAMSKGVMPKAGGGSTRNSKNCNY